jgi:hypothetical protein
MEKQSHSLRADFLSYTSLLLPEYTEGTTVMEVKSMFEIRFHGLTGMLSAGAPF